MPRRGAGAIGGAPYGDTISLENLSLAALTEAGFTF